MYFLLNFKKNHSQRTESIMRSTFKFAEIISSIYSINLFPLKVNKMGLLIDCAVFTLSAITVQQIVGDIHNVQQCIYTFIHKMYDE